MAGSMRTFVTDGQTDGRTDGADLIGPAGGWAVPRSVKTGLYQVLQRIYLTRVDSNELALTLEFLQS